MELAQATTPFQLQCQFRVPSLSSSASCSSRVTSYGGQRAPPSEFWGSRSSTSRLGRLGGKEDEEGARWESGKGNKRSSSGKGMCVKAEGFNFWEVLGGRGLKGGEKSTNTEEGMKKLFSEPEGSGKKNNGDGGVEGRVEVSGIDGFDKELSGLVGGFPGGEKGLGKFLEEYPPPVKKGKESKADQELEILLKVLGGTAKAKPKTIVPPLLMPGMTVIVSEPKNPYYMYSGIVQRVTDGRAGVLFEGGNWDKLITFKLTELERTAKGPPMVNPKSAILLQQQTPVPPS
ncbi:unnamed protein product [Calypogeia fissa]